MAGHVQDRWYKTVTTKNLDGTETTTKVKTDRYGIGNRYRARYIGPDGREQNKSFPDRQKRKAEDWLTNIEADISRGQYLDPRAGRVTFEDYVTQWISTQTTDHATRSNVEIHLRLHAVPYLGRYPLASMQPAHIRTWVSDLEKTGLSTSYRRIIFGNVSTVLTAAVDDGHLVRNPCRMDSVRPPKPAPGRLKPWTTERVFDVQLALPERFRAMVDVGAGCGLRQGEIFGLPVEDVDPLDNVLHVTQQIKLLNNKRYFAPPKGGKPRDVPLPDGVAQALAAHATAFEPQEVTLPWGTPDGPEVTKVLYFTRQNGGGLVRTEFNRTVWKHALAKAGVIPAPKRGEKHAEAREDGMHALRHYYASVLLDAGENIKALSHYLGHADPGFTLRTYTHLMPRSETRTRKALDDVYRSLGRLLDGP